MKSRHPEKSFDDQFYDAILAKKEEFEKLSNQEQEQFSQFSSEQINNDISYNEVSNAIDKIKFHKAFLEIPNEAMKTQMQKVFYINFSIFVLSLVSVRPIGTTVTLFLYPKRTKIKETLFKIGV